ncbi:MAG: hypothetical protein VX700_04580 [Pseudomonadota bacterium]|nr:hypothetical protein [Pseudomonadota bacterium]
MGVAYVVFPTPGQLADAVDEAKASGLIARLIEKHGVTGKLSVAHAK